jgi:outer membrane protein
MYRRLLLGLLLLAAVVVVAPAAHAQGAAGLRVGVVNIDEAINTSQAGERSKKILQAAQAQKRSELQAQEQELKTLQEELQGNIMLSQEAKAQRTQELQNKQQELRAAVQQAQRELAEQERSLTNSMIAEIRTIVELVAKEEGLDFVLEQSAARVILFARIKFIDVTDKVIERYNKIGAGS